MRRGDNSTKTFRELASEVATLLTYEATADLETEDATVEGWAGPIEIRRIKGRKVNLVPILRAGLGLLPGVLELDRKSVVQGKRGSVRVDLCGRRIIKTKKHDST